MPDKICFVVMGFGVKTDYRTGRQLDLDKTFEFLIKPVFDDLKITCFRACDVPHSGVIDLPMYENILKADIVVADISTLNANAIYELGVRHALKPQTTIVIAEKELPFPFDLNHISITSYVHLGVDIGSSEAKRFCALLKTLVQTVLDAPNVDSPVYTYLSGLTPPVFTSTEKSQIKAAVEASVESTDSVATLVKEAEDFKNEKKYDEAIAKLQRAREMDPNNPFIVQRIALVTYKSKLPDEVTALKNALEILSPLSPETTNDPETLGLCGAINKKLFEIIGLGMYSEKAKNFYERGFIVSKDYYNGINYAYLLLLSASLATNENDKITDITNAKRVRSKTQQICLNLTNQENFSEMKDRVWILLTLAEIAFIESGQDEADKYLRAATAEGAVSFELDSYTSQKEKLVAILDKLNIK